MGVGAQVVQNLQGASLRSFRITDTARRMNRYAVFADKKLQDVGFPSDVNELRSYLYTFSIFTQDINSLVPISFLNKVNRFGLRIAKLTGDYNAVRNTILQKNKELDVAGIGERAVRRVGGRVTGKVLKTIPPGKDPISNALFRAVRSTAGANITIEMDKFIKSSRTPAASVIMAANFTKLMKKGEFTSEVLANYIMQKLKEKTPVDSGRLYQSIKMRKGRADSKSSIPYHLVEIGNIKPMPDPKVPYPWVVEFGINRGYGVHKYAAIDQVFPIPLRFRFLQKVTGPRPEGDEYFQGSYDNDNRSPYTRSAGNKGKGAMMRTALWEIIEDANRFNFKVGIPKYKTNPFKEIVWDKAQDIVKKNPSRVSTREYDLPF